MNDSEKISLLDKSVMIAIYPALGYFLICIHEVGYIITFNIPVEFININISNFINIIPMIFIKLLTFFLFWNSISRLIYIEELGNPIAYKIYQMLKVSAYFLIMASFWYDKSFIWSTLSAIIIYFLFYFSFPLIAQRKIKGYKNKLLAQINLEKNDYSKTLTWYHIKIFGYINMRFIFLLIFVAIIMFNSGMAEAMLKTNYYKLNDNVVIRIYNDVIICCEYDSKSKKIDDSSFKVLQKDNIDNLKFEEIVLNSKASEIKK